MVSQSVVPFCNQLLMVPFRDQFLMVSQSVVPFCNQLLMVPFRGQLSWSLSQWFPLVISLILSVLLVAPRTYLTVMLVVP
jgi:hypothetical protein